jgi:chromosomal replication initiator protein
MLQELLDKWDEILFTLKNDYEITDVSFKTWIEPITVHSVTDNTITLVADTSNVGLNIINKKYKEAFIVAISEALNHEFDVQFLLPAQVLDLSNKESSHSPKSLERDLTSSIIKNRKLEANLNLNYTFDTFVVGPNSRYAHAAALATAESPGTLYNPLFIYGGVGLGKTHLIQSIAHFIIENNENARVLYTTSEDFTNQFIDAIRNGGNTTAFKNKYRNIDALIIDDIQFLINKEGIQEEFFNTFNALRMADKQIIISSDKPPKDMNGLEDRLRTRFEAGLSIDIQAPDYETRMAILKTKSEKLDYHISNEILDYIATNIKSNIRTLEGALIKLNAFSKVSHTPLTLEDAVDILKDTIYPDMDKQITPQIVLETVADHFALSVADLTSKKRTKDIAFARQIYMYLGRQLTDESLKSIGALVNKKDHTTISYGIEKIDKSIKEDEMLRTTIEVIKKKIIPS